MKELWKDIVGYEGLYQVSNFGSVKSLPRKDRRGNQVIERILKQDCADKYPMVHLSKDGVTKSMRIHRLVATAFLDNPNNYHEVNHKDENKLNNRVDNLEWCTRAYNCNYGTAIKRMRLKLGKPVLQKDLDGNVIARWNSYRDAELQFGKITGALSQYLKHSSSATYKGYLWERC